ncbi:PilZ domain-containing protein [Lysobacter fragariae]
MKEFRRSRRRQVAETVHIIDSMTEVVIGNLGNLSETGMLVMASAPLVPDALYQLRFSLPDGPTGRGKPSIEVGAQLLWNDQASAAGQAWAGFRFISMSDDQMMELRSWIDAPGSRYA